MEHDGGGVVTANVALNTIGFTAEGKLLHLFPIRKIVVSRVGVPRLSTAIAEANLVPVARKTSAAPTFAEPDH